MEPHTQCNIQCCLTATISDTVSVVIDHWLLRPLCLLVCVTTEFTWKSGGIFHFPLQQPQRKDLAGDSRSLLLQKHEQKPHVQLLTGPKGVHGP